MIIIKLKDNRTEVSYLHKFVMISQAVNHIWHFINLILSVSSKWCNVACILVGLAKAVADGNVPTLISLYCNTYIVRMAKIA